MTVWLEWIREMIGSLEAGYFPNLGVWSYLFLGVLVATEGPLSTLLGAAAAAAGILDVRWVFVATVAGNVVGDTLWYSVGYMRKTSWLLHGGRWLGIESRHLARLEREMHAHAAKLIIFAKLAYGLIVPTLVAAGVARVPWRRWFPVVFIIETLWSLLLVWVGWHATGWIAEFERGLQVVGAVAMVVVLGAVFWLIRRRIDRKESEMDPARHALQRAPVVFHRNGQHGTRHLRAGNSAADFKVEKVNQEKPRPQSALRPTVLPMRLQSAERVTARTAVTKPAGQRDVRRP